MNISDLLKEASRATGVRLWMVTLFSLNSVALVLLLFVFIVRGDTHRETLVPPIIHQSFWVDDDEVSKEYLIEMGVFLAQIYYDVNPANVDFNHATLKKYVSPQYFGRLETESGAFSAKIKNDNASTFFAISSVVPDEKKKRIALTGLLNTFLGDSRTSSITKTYIFEFTFKGGRLLLNSMKESKNANRPFDETANK